MLSEANDKGGALGVAMAIPWDIPPLAEIGDMDANAIFVAVGRALTEWEHLETALGQLFAFLVGAQVSYPNNEPAMRAYGSVVSFQGRASMLEEAAAGYFHAHPSESFEDRFHQIVTVECRHFSGRRNDIAHGRSQQAWQRDGKTGHFLTPGYHSSKGWKIGATPAPKYLYTSKEIGYFREQFEDLYDKVAGLVNDMMDVQRASSNQASP
jgi:hypothetical protein